MEILLFIAEVLLLSISYWFYCKKTKQSLTRPGPWLLLFTLSLSSTLIGFFIVANFDGFMSFGIDGLIGEEVKQETLLDFVLCWSITFIIFGLLHQYVIVQKNINSSPSHQCAKVLLIFSIVLLTIDFINLPEIPAIKLYLEGIDGGLASRGRMIIFQINNGIPVINIIIRTVPLVSIIWLYYYYLVTNKYKNFLILTIVYSVYNFGLLTKGFFLAPLIPIFWVYANNTLKKLGLKEICFVMGLLLVIFIVIYGDAIVAVNSLLHRLFISQAEGAFLIREYYKSFDINAMLYGFPFSKLLGIDGRTFDPSSEVVKIAFGEIEGWVNVNSYFIGQGSVMLGGLIIILGPLLIFINGYAMKIFSKLFRNCNKNNITYIAWGSLVINIPLNTNFGLILYLKPFFSFIITLIFLELILVIRNKL